MFSTLFCELQSDKTYFGEYFDVFLFCAWCGNTRVVGWQSFRQFTASSTHTKYSRIFYQLQYYDRKIFFGMKYSRIFYLFCRPTFFQYFLVECTHAFFVTSSVHYFLLQNTHAFFTTFLLILYVVQNTHAFCATFFGR